MTEQDAEGFIEQLRIAATVRKAASAAESAYAFVVESNRIEGITRRPTRAECEEFTRFMALPRITVSDLEAFVSIYQPGAVLRDRPEMNVRVGNYFPPRGGPDIRKLLDGLLDCCDTADPWFTHKEYERIHPFTDGNGRSGRMLWAWQMKGNFPLGFLHHFYYQTLQN